MAYTTIDNIGTNERLANNASGFVILTIQHDRGMIDALLIKILNGQYETNALMYPSEVFAIFGEAVSLICSTMPQEDIERFKRLADAGKSIPPQLAQAVANTISLMNAELAIAREKENSRADRGSLKSSAVLK
jgi:hypothetical protein